MNFFLARKEQLKLQKEGNAHRLLDARLLAGVVLQTTFVVAGVSGHVRCLGGVGIHFE